MPALIPSMVKAESQTVMFFSGNAEMPKTIDLSEYNRISFSDDCITLSSSKDASIEQIELLYSLYHHIEFGEGEVVSVTENLSESQSLFYRELNRELMLAGVENCADYTIGVFSVNGSLLVSKKMDSTEVCDVANLAPGMYVAIATNGEINLRTKFIIKK